MHCMTSPGKSKYYLIENNIKLFFVIQGSISPFGRQETFSKHVTFEKHYSSTFRELLFFNHNLDCLT
jgi:hypothetical protein